MKSIFTTALCLLGLMVAVNATNPPATDGGLKIGDVAPGFSLKSTSGDMVSLDDFEGVNGYIVIFTCNHCPYSVAYEDRIIELHNKYASTYPVIAINPNDPNVQKEDSYEKMKTRASEKEFPFVYLFDEGQKVYPQYGATRTPHVFLLDKEKTVQYIGAIDDSPRAPDSVGMKYLENAIGSLEAGKSIDPSFTKAVGCSIKVKKS